MNLKEFDFIIGRMKLAYVEANNLGQSTEQARILFQMNSLLPDSLQIYLGDLENDESITQSLSFCQTQINSQISEYREQLMLN